ISSQHVPSVAGLRRVHLLRGDWEAALEALTAEIELAEAPDERAALLFARALILEERLAQADRSRESYALALEQTPGDASILRALARASRREGDHAALRSVLEAQANLAENDAALSAARLAERARHAELYPA